MILSLTVKLTSSCPLAAAKWGISIPARGSSAKSKTTSP